MLNLTNIEIFLIVSNIITYILVFILYKKYKNISNIIVGLRGQLIKSHDTTPELIEQWRTTMDSLQEGSPRWVAYRNRLNEIEV